MPIYNIAVEIKCENVAMFHVVGGSWLLYLVKVQLVFVTKDSNSRLIIKNKGIYFCITKQS